MAIQGVDISSINATTTVVNTLFHESYQQSLTEGNNWVQPLLREVTTVKKFINFIFYGDVDEPEQVPEGQSPEYTEFLGYQLQLGMRRYQNAARIKIIDWFEDEFGMLNDQVMKMASKYALIPRFIAADILDNGATSAWLTYDGVPLFDNAHVIGAGTFDNRLAGTGDLSLDIQTAFIAMMQFQTDKGIVRDNNEPSHIVIPPGLIFSARQVLDNTKDPNDNKNTENVTRGLVQTPIVEPRLTDDNNWFLLRAAAGEIPFVLIRHSALDDMRLVADNDENSDGVKNHEEFRWWVRGRKSLHPTHPHLFLLMENA